MARSAFGGGVAKRGEVNRTLLDRALAKRRNGQQLTQREERALEKAREAERQKAGDEYVRSVPKGTYCEWADKQQKVVNEHGERYRLPVKGRTVDVTAVIESFHRFLSDNNRELSAIRGEQGAENTLEGKLKQEKIEQLEHRNKVLELQIAERRGELISREAVHEHLARLAKLLRAADERLQKRCGEEAHAILEAAINDFESQLVVDDGRSD